MKNRHEDGQDEGRHVAVLLFGFVRFREQGDLGRRRIGVEGAWRGLLEATLQDGP